MSAFRASLLPTVNAIRGLRETFGTSSEYTVVIRTETFASREHQGTPTVADLAILPRPKVKERNSGRELEVGPITPSHAGGGFTPAQLNPQATATEEQRVTYRVTGPNGTRLYRCVDIDTSRGYHYTLRLVALERDLPR